MPRTVQLQGPVNGSTTEKKETNQDGSAFGRSVTYQRDHANVEQGAHTPLRSLSGTTSRAEDEREQRSGETIVEGVLAQRPT